MKKIINKYYPALTKLNLVLIWCILVTGALVRLTKSGLGCQTWPRCDLDSFAPKTLSFHTNIEWGNRLITGLVSIVVIIVLLFSFFIVENKKQIIKISVLIFAGVVGQIVLGGITVLSHLNPFAVGSHMLVSLYLIIVSKILVIRSSNKEIDFKKYMIYPYIFYIFVVLAGIGTTGAGPHAGNANVQRFNWTITDSARIHSIAAWLLLISLILIFIKYRKSLTKSFYIFILLVVLQMGIGYLQYFLKVPAYLVGVHIAMLGFITMNLFNSKTKV